MKLSQASLYEMAREMAKPVARGMMPLEHAYAAMINATLRAERAGVLGPYLAPDVFRGQRHLLQQHLEQWQSRREVTAHRVKRTVAPFIAQRRPKNVLMAEAHGVNGADGFPLSEEEVANLVTAEVFYSLPPASPGRRHGR